MTSENKNLGTHKKNKWKTKTKDKHLLVFLATIFVLCILISFNEILDLPNFLRGEKIHPTDWLEFTTEMSAILLVGLSSIFLLKKAESKRRRAEEALKESENRYRSLIEGQNEAIYRMSLPDGRYEYFSPAALVVFGYSAKEFLDNPLLIKKIMHPDFADYFKEKWEDLIEGRVPPTYEYKIIDAKGKEKWIIQSNTGIFDSKGSIIALEGICRDISERKQAEKELRESEERFRQLAENIDQVFWLTDWRNNKLLYVNPSYEKLFGRSCQSVYEDRLNWYQVIHPDDRAPVRESLVQNAKLGRSTEVEYRIVRDDGTMRWILDRNYPIRDQHGEVYRIVSIAEDITERKRAEEELRVSEEKHRLILDNIPVFIAAIDQTGKFVLWNKYAERMLGYIPQEAIGKIIPLDIHETKKDADEVIQVASERGIYDKEIRFRCKNKTFIPVHLVVVPSKDSTGKTVGFYGFAEDITERKRAEETLKRERDFSQSILETANSMIVCLDGRAKITVFNQECERVTGYRREEVLGKVWPELFLPPDQCHAKLKSFAKWVRAHPSDRYESPVVTKSGEIRTILWSNTAILGSDEVEVVAIAIGYDITERKRAEEALREQKEVMQTILENIPVMIAFLDSRGNHKWVNPAWQKKLGWSLKDAQSRDVLKEFYPDPEYYQYVVDFISKAESNWGDFRTRRRDGTVLDTIWTNVPLSDGSNIGIGLDITERKRAEEALRESEEKYRALIEAAGRAGEGIIIIQDSGEGEAAFVFVNNQFCRMSGYSREELLGRSPWDLVPHEISVRLIDWYKRRHMGESLPGHYEAAGVHKDGTIVPLELSIVTMPWQGRIATVLYLRDITERKRAEEEAIRHTENIEFLSKAAMEFMELPVEKDIYRCIGEQLRELIGDAIYILVNSYDQKTRKIQARVLLADDQYIQVVSKTLGTDPMGMSFVVSDEAWNGLTSGKLVRVPGGIHELSFGKISKAACDALEKLAVTGDIFVMGFTKKGELYGSATIIMQEGCELRNSDIVETFIRQAGVALQRKRAEQALKESEERLKLVLEGAELGTWDQNMKTGEVVRNHRWAEMLGYTLEEIDSHADAWKELIHPDDLPIVNRIVEDHEAGRTPFFRCEHRMRTKSSEWKWILNCGKIIQWDSDGKPVRATGTHTDITERKKLEEALKRSEWEKGIILDSMSEMVIYQDREQRIVWANRAACEWYDLAPDKLKGRHCYELRYNRTESCPNCPVQEVFKTNQIQENEILAPNGRILYVRSYPARDEKEEVVGVVEVALDITERKRAEEQIAYQAQLLAIVNDAVVASDAQYRLTAWNATAESMYGWKAEEVLGRFGLDVTRTEFPGVDKAEMLRVIAERGSWRGEATQARKDGTRFPVEISSVVLRDATGKVTGFVSVNRDITERKRAEEALQKSYSELSSLFDGLPLGVSYLTQDLRFVRINKTLETFIGHTEEEVLGKFCYEFVGESAQNPSQQGAERICSTCKTLEAITEGKIKEKEGRLGDRTFYIICSPVKDKNETVIGVMELIQDITERKRAEKELEKSRQRYKDLFELAPDSIVTLNLDGVITSCNAAGERLSGYSKEELIGKHLSQFEIFKAGEKSQYLQLFESIRKGMLSGPIEINYVRKDGTPSFAEAHVGLLKEGDKTTGFQIITRDFTERKRAEEALRESEEKWRSLVENAPNIILIANSDGTIQFINRTLPPTTIEETIGNSIYDHIEPQYHHLVRETIQHVFQTGEPGHYEIRGVGPHGITSWYDTQVGPIMHDGKVVAITLISTDITERKKTEEALRENQAKLQSIFSTAPAGIGMTIDHTIKELNTRLCEISGYSKEELLGKCISLVYPSDEDYHSTRRKIYNQLAEKEISTIETCWKRKEDKLIYVLLNCALLKPGDFSQGITFTVLDITERKQAEEEYKTILDTAMDGFTIDDMQGRILEVNDAYCRLVGYTRDELLTMRISDVEAVERQGETAQRIKKIMEVGGDRFETRHRCKDGRIVNVEISVNYIDAGGGRLFVFARDITERKRAEEALKMSEAKSRAILKAMPDSMFRITKDGIFLEAMPTKDLSVYLPPNEFAGKSVYQITPEIAEQFMRGVKKALETDEIQIFEYPLPLQGEIRYHEARIVPNVKDEVLSIVRDITERKRAEEVLKMERNRLEEVTKNIGAGLAIISKDFRTLWANQVLKEIFGEVEGKICYSTYNQRNQICPACGVQEIFETGKDKVVHEQVGKDKDGNTIWSQIVATPIRDQNGNITAALELVVPITERKRAEEALRESQKRFQALTETTSDFVWEMDANGVYTYCSPQIHELWGYKPEDMIGRTPFDLMMPEDREYAIKMFRTISESPSSFKGMETRSLDNTGRIVVLETSGVPFFDIDGRLRGYRGISRDITERKRAEEALKESEEKWRSLVNNAPNMIIIVNRDSTIQFINRTVSPLTIEETIGKSIYDYVEPEHHNVVRETIEHVFQTGEPGSYEIRGVGSQGYSSWYETQVGPIKHDEQIVAVTLIITDITERKQAEEVLRQTRDYLESLFNYANAPIICWDAQFKITRFNHAFEHLAEYKAEEVMGKDLSMLFPKENQEESLSKIKRTLSGEHWEVVEIPILRKSGDIRMVLWNSANVYAGDGKTLIATIAQGQDITERKWSEEALRVSEEKYRTLFETMAQGVVYQDRTGRITSANLAAEAILGLTLDQLLGRTSSDPRWKAIQEDGSDFPGETHPSMVALKTGKPVRNEIMGVFHPQESRYHWIIINAIPQFKPGNDTPYQVYTTFSDITERKRAEEELQRTHFAIDSAPEGIAWLDKNFHYIYVNEGMCRMLGYTHAELLSLKPSQIDLMFPEVPPAELWVEMRGIKSQVREGLFRRKDGTIFPVELTIDYVVFQDEEYIFAIMRDITERKQVEEALRESEERYRNLFEKSPIGIYRTTPDGRILMANPALIRMLGYSSFEELASRNLEKEGYAASYPRGQFKQLIESKVEVKGLEAVWLKSDKSVLFVRENAKVVRDDKGTILYYEGTAEDITERKKMEAQLIQAERLSAVGTLAYGIAHEFNNVLAGILGNAEFGLITNDPKEVQECFQIIQENCERAKSITNHLLAFSRQRETKKQKADVTDAVESVLGLVERELEKQNIKVVRRFNPVPEIVCDLGELSEVTLNMITNARDAMRPKGGMLTLEISKKGDNVEMVFTDTGCGIPDSIKERIFEPFVTTKGALGQSETPGTGLGLFLSYGIISRYQGTIQVKSEMGKGSQFTIKIPISKNQTVPVSVYVEGDEPVDVPPNLNILLVDDEKPILSSVKKFLELKGHSVIACPSGKKGLQLFKNKVFDLVLSDITMPDIDGIKLISKFKSIDKDVKLIVLTGHLAEEKLNSARKAGADQVLTKPFKNEDLYKAMGRVLSTDSS